MANEVGASASLSALKSGASLSCSHSVNLTMTGAGMPKIQWTATTTATAMPFTGITGAPEKLLIKNLDGTNFVQIDSAAAMNAFPQKLVAGDVILLSPQTDTIYAKADTASCLLEFAATEA